MERKSFNRMIGQTLPTLTSEETEKVENHIFRIYDANGDGVIDFHEFMTVFMILTGDEPRSVLERMFLIFDVDNSGLITKVFLFLLPQLYWTYVLEFKMIMIKLHKKSLLAPILLVHI